MKKIIACSLIFLMLCITMSCLDLLPEPEPTTSRGDAYRPDTDGILTWESNGFKIELLSKAEIDECYNGVGESYVPGPVCNPSETPKANQSYLWGLTKSGNNMWIGTGANLLCTMRAATFFFVDFNKDADEAEHWVCEYAEGRYPEDNISRRMPKIYSDFRPPKVYVQNLSSYDLTDITAQITDSNAISLLENTFGMRSASAIGNLVFMAGPVGLGKGINIFAFNATTGELIDSKRIYKYANIRKWLVMDGVLYTTVQNAFIGGGKILRWSGTESDPINFTEVGDIDTSGAEIVAHNGRIYVATWPQKVKGPSAGIWRSPIVPEGGLTEADLNSWEKVWEPAEYEPDPAGAHLYGVGAMASYQGKLYWGTMHVTSSSTFRIITRYMIGPAGWSDAYKYSRRAISIFRSEDFNDSDDVELLYGDAEQPVYHPSILGGQWTMEPNNMGGVEGTYGSCGFGNPYNNYTWTMAVYDGKLFVGTMDNSILWSDVAETVDDMGADLWYFPSGEEEAVAVTENGFINFTNYGIRTIYADDDTGLYCGTANPCNIAVDDSGVNPIGGWELIRVSSSSQQ